MFVLATTIAGFQLLSYIAYTVGKEEESLRQFVANYREPNVDEIWIKLTMDYISNSSEYNDIFDPRRQLLPSLTLMFRC